MVIEMRPWADRSNTIGFVPGKKQNRKQALRDILGQLPLASGREITVMMADGKTVTTPVDELCGSQLSRGALARREASGQWVATEAAKKWLRDSDDDALANHLHANVKFFGELLDNIEGVQTKADLLKTAHSYGLTWTSTDQLYRRISWMEVLGLVEKWGSNKFVVTERGRALLARVELASIEHAIGISTTVDDVDVVLPDPGEAVSALLDGLTPQKAQKRKAIIGYIPRGRKAPDRESDAGSQSPFDAIRTLVDLLGEGASVEEFYDRCGQQLGMKRTSASQTLQTMRYMKVFDMVAYNQYGADSDTLELLELGSEIDFIRFMHTRYKFIGELLTLLDEATPVPQVARIASETYGYSQIDNGEVRTRLGFMADAGLVERVDWTRYRVTPLGKLLADEMTLELPRALKGIGDAELVEAQAPEPPSTQKIAADLREYSRRSDASTEFEIAVADAFRFLGFNSEHLGGSGRTDVVVDAHLPDKDGYRTIVDAKASATGMITDNLIKFDALKDHQKKHRADFGMVVGPDFADRVREWAVNNNFTLLTVEDLVGLLERHAEHPLTLPELRILFERTGDDLADIEEQYSAAERSAALLTKLIELLYAEAREEDPLLDGYISLENVNYVLRKELSPRPSASAVEDCLQFLAHDLVRGVVRTGSKYKLADAPSNIMRRLAGLGADLEAVTLSDS